MQISFLDFRKAHEAALLSRTWKTGSAANIVFVASKCLWLSSFGDSYAASTALHIRSEAVKIGEVRKLALHLVNRSIDRFMHMWCFGLTPNLINGAGQNITQALYSRQNTTMQIAHLSISSTQAYSTTCEAPARCNTSGVFGQEWGIFSPVLMYAPPYVQVVGTIRRPISVILLWPPSRILKPHSQVK